MPDRLINARSIPDLARSKDEAVPNAKNEIKFPMSASEAADLLGYDAKSIRARMRKMTSKDAQPGSGGRWVIESQADLDDIAAAMRSGRTNGRTVAFKSQTPEATPEAK